MYMRGTVGFRARPLTELFLWLAHVCDWSLWWVGAGPVVSPPGSVPRVPSAQINHRLMEANISFLDTVMWVRQSSVSAQCDSTAFLTEWSLVQWLMLWCQCVRSLVGSGTVKSNETKEKLVVCIQTKPNLDDFLTSSHICVSHTVSRGRKCYILRLEIYCAQVCKHRFIEIFHVKFQLIWAHEHFYILRQYANSSVTQNRPRLHNKNIFK